MIKKIQYTDLVSRKTILDANTDKYLVEEQNITEGNFLIFTDAKPLENQLVDLSDNQLVLMDVLATMYEDMSVKGTV